MPQSRAFLYAGGAAIIGLKKSSCRTIPAIKGYINTRMKECLSGRVVISADFGLPYDCFDPGIIAGKKVDASALLSALKSWPPVSQGEFNFFSVLML